MRHDAAHPRGPAVNDSFPSVLHGATLSARMAGRQSPDARKPWGVLQHTRFPGLPNRTAVRPAGGTLSQTVERVRAFRYILANPHCPPAASRRVGRGRVGGELHGG